MEKTFKQNPKAKTIIGTGVVIVEVEVVVVFLVVVVLIYLSLVKRLD